MNKLITTALLVLLVFSCKSPEARRPVSTKSGSYIDASIALNKKRFAKEKAVIEKIIEADTDEYLASDTGFWYKYQTKTENDSLSTPNFGDIINYDYNIKTLNGNEIYSKADLKTQNYAMDKQELFTGLRHGLKLMKIGETVTFIFPSDRAYGYYGDENKIGPNTPLICEVTVNSITPNQSN
ncbi:gliding motility-associated peptidyl-prolyl isomerase GldI [Algibacter sp. L4_22]|uniref:gliding motility-associated peptidyl-prolyl isomerase GldI n=1 Tax=Algibacter sp. L4_22 TaxID=2942477 RepID=UPI00201B60FC|nr:gliding motility-associated peptidyl-prolyl isomerase GldI [Algibacter sp. L4_22]MCL5130419.1 gliding motility-associated peptidyl-prolyl isomerase GldI [Algibacter sp. L4_22]